MPLCYDTIIYKTCICQKHNRIETRVFVSTRAKCFDVGEVITKVIVIFVEVRICMALRVLRAY